VLTRRIKDIDENIEELVEDVLNSQIERVGEFLKIDAIFLEINPQMLRNSQQHYKNNQQSRNTCYSWNIQS